MQIEVNINSPIFKDFVSALDSAILRCVAEIHAENFSGGEISAKIIIDAIEFKEDYQSETYHYKNPKIEHKVVVTLKKKTETKGIEYKDGFELAKCGENFLLREVPAAQTNIYEIGGGLDEPVN